MVEELSDREQEEALRAWLKENWRWMVGGVALGVALLVGYNYWGTYREQRAAEAFVAAAEVRKAIDAKDVDKATKLLAGLTQEHGSTPYTQAARLQLAKLQVVVGKYDEAVKLLGAVAEDSKDDELRKVAQLRQARLLIQLGKQDQALAMLEPDDSGQFSAAVQEVRGDALLAKGDKDGARAAYAAALKSTDSKGTQSPIDRGLIELKLQDMGGKVPAPEPPATEAKAADAKAAAKAPNTDTPATSEKVQP
jgi:predicted negative regulator of RcsB-dependent stress response